MPVTIADYPKWIERDGENVLVQSEEEELDIDLDAEKEAIKKDIEENYDREVNLAEYQGVGGMGALRAYYEAVKNGNSDDDS